MLYKMPPPVTVENLHQNVQLIFTLTGWITWAQKLGRKIPRLSQLRLRQKVFDLQMGTGIIGFFFPNSRLLEQYDLTTTLVSLNLYQNDKYKTQRKNKAQSQIQTGFFSRLSVWHPHFGHGMMVQVARESTDENGLQMWPWTEHKTRAQTQSKQQNTKSVRPLFCCMLILRNLNLCPFSTKKWNLIEGSLEV